MRSLAVKQQQTNRAQDFASGRHSGTCASVCVCDCFLDLFSGNYVKVTALESFKVRTFHPQSYLKSQNIQIICFVANIWCIGFFFTEHPIAAFFQCIISAISSSFVVVILLQQNLCFIYFWVFFWKALKPQACDFVSVWCLVQIQICTGGA